MVGILGFGDYKGFIMHGLWIIRLMDSGSGEAL